MINSESEKSNKAESSELPLAYTERKHVFDRIECMFAPHKNKKIMLQIKEALIKLAEEGLLNE